MTTTDTSYKRSPLKFFILVLALWTPFILFGAAPLGLPVNLPVGAIAALCPLIVALMLVGMEEGPGGVKRLLTKVVDHKEIRPRIWYAPIILLVPATVLLSYGIMRLVGRPPPPPDIPVLAIPILSLLFLIGAVGEEAGWTGYAIDPMQQRWGALRASVILGSVWATLHVVGWYIQTHHTLMWTVGMWVQTVALRILIVWLCNNTGKSVLTAVLFHAMMNVCSLLFPNYYDPVIVGTIAAIAAVIVTFLWGPKTLARYRYAAAQRRIRLRRFRAG